MDGSLYSPLVTEAGHFTIGALDHRDALAAELSAAGQTNGPEALVEFKKDIITALGDRPSAVMLEPEYSLPGLAGDVAAGVGITCALEAQGYFADPTAGNRLMDGWSPKRVTEVGADGAKLLLLYRPDRGEFSRAQEALARRVVEESAEVGIPALIEPVPVEVENPRDRASVIIESAARISTMGNMIVKVPFPGPGRCGELDEAVGDNPWVLLSWGIGYEEYRQQLIEACAHGCSGFTAGRALWREGIAASTRAEFTSGLLLERFDELASIAATGRSVL